MNGYRFYADIEANIPPLPSPIKVRHLKFFGDRGQYVNCLALVTNGTRPTSRALAPSTSQPNSDVSFDRVDRDYLSGCLRIPEKIARKLHPRLFERLDNI